MSAWVANAPSALCSLFTKTVRCADEAEALLGKRRDNEHEVTIQIKTEFMQLWDGLTTDRHAGVLVLAATNRPGELDEAVLRRFSRQYEVRSPGVSRPVSAYTLA